MQFVVFFFCDYMKKGSLAFWLDYLQLESVIQRDKDIQLAYCSSQKLRFMILFRMQCTVYLLLLMSLLMED